ncbi:prothymosin alpha-like isoform B [Patagioenas fasciata monilis]|uniref:Prothymosin alpha-like isoform B n=1 Tax=Patagioenas fasciata monilis TaxID=372326 RepID=A0A1V4KMC8_PATFA|nr:prothymosin alpha-like isoform B [Patagioenas fasciata monilis]
MLSAAVPVVGDEPFCPDAQGRDDQPQLRPGSRAGAKDLKEKKEVVEETENGRDAPANGNAVSEEEDGDEDDEAEGATGKRAAEDDEDDDVDPKKQKTDEDD